MVATRESDGLLPRLIQLAEANGFLVVFPDGVGLGPNADKFRTWNGGYCCGTAVKQNVDDVAFISALIDAIGIFGAPTGLPDRYSAT